MCSSSAASCQPIHEIRYVKHTFLVRVLLDQGVDGALQSDTRLVHLLHQVRPTDSTPAQRTHLNLWSVVKPLSAGCVDRLERLQQLLNETWTEFSCRHNRQL